MACVPGAFFTPANIPRPSMTRTEVTSFPRPAGPAGKLTRARTSPPGPRTTARLSRASLTLSPLGFWT